MVLSPNLSLASWQLPNPDSPEYRVHQHEKVMLENQNHLIYVSF
jgi:hypothetical protein